MRQTQRWHVFKALQALVSKKLSSPTRGGVVLHQDDKDTTVDVFVQFFCILTDVGHLVTPVNSSLVGRVLSELFPQQDILPVLSGFEKLYNLLRVDSPVGFKAQCRSMSPTLFSLIERDYDNMISGDVLATKRLIQVFAYTSRISLKHIDLESQCLTDYMGTEDSITIPTGVGSVLKSMSLYIQQWLADFDDTELEFGHGPGSTAFCGRVLQQKYLKLTTDPLLNYVYKDEVLIVRKNIKPLKRISQTIFVPKSYKTFRTISMEPPTLMYYQQGVWREIDRVVQSRSYTKNRIGFHDQQRNQQLAKLGSSSRAYATIDLSAASDSVSWWLVKKLFGKTRLYRHIVATRSRQTFLPNKELVTLKKFAPMGSALCFPIETLIFAAICELVTRRHSHTTGGRRVFGDYSVFGDDIIVPTECAPDVISVLSMLGFRVNSDKSFTDPACAYRESCGGEYIAGIDVTPMRVSRNFQRLYHHDGVRVYALIDMANEAYLRGLWTLRLTLIERLRKLGFVIAFGDSLLYSDFDTNYQTRTRYNRNLQRREALTTRFFLDLNDVPVRKGRHDIGLLHWLASTRFRLPEVEYDRFESRVGYVKSEKLKKASHFVSLQPSVDEQKWDRNAVYLDLVLRSLAKVEDKNSDTAHSLRRAIRN